MAEAAAEEQVEHSRVHPLDPDFILFALPFAVLVDSLDIILEITGVFVIPKILGVFLDIVTFFLLGLWLYWRTGKLIKSKRQQQASQRLGGAMLRGPMRKVLIRLGLTFIVEAIPFVGIFFTWTLMVILTLREK